MTFYFGNGDDTDINRARKAMIHVSFEKDLEVVKTVVDWDALPIRKDTEGGFEAVTTFHVNGFKNDGVFYTDSNGLEMQKRKLNYRPTWDLVEVNYKKSLENITANFYPINSAVSMTEGQRRFTVMNDRSQAGASLEDGSF